MTLENDFKYGVASGITGFLLIILVQAFVPVFVTLHSPWWVYGILIAYVVFAIILDMLFTAVTGLVSTIGFAFGAWIVGDWWAAVAVAVLYVVITVIKNR